MQDFHEYMDKYPHNTDCGDRFERLIELAYRVNKQDQTKEAFIQGCLDSYGGTVAGAMIDYLYNQ